MPLKRTHSWDTNELHKFFEERRSLPFAWGTNDCCIFPADAIHAMTGLDLAEDFRGKYTDEASAFALIREVAGGETVADAAAWCAQKFELSEWTAQSGEPAPLFAQRGDLVVLQPSERSSPGAPEDSGRMIAGIVGLTGRHVISVGEKGLLRLPLSAVVRAWKI